MTSWTNVVVACALCASSHLAHDVRFFPWWDTRCDGCLCRIGFPVADQSRSYRALGRLAQKHNCTLTCHRENDACPQSATPAKKTR